MDAFCQQLIPQIADEGTAAFVEGAWYYREMDYLLFLTEDCSYRADRVDAFLTVLWHPYEERLVGIMVKGFRFLFQRLRSILDLTEDDFLPLVKCLEAAMIAGEAESMMDKMEESRRRRLRDRYSKALDIAGGISVPPDEWRLAA